MTTTRAHHAPPATYCGEYGHLFDTLYPKSQYRCDGCGSVHGTRAVNGAVSWQCFDCPGHHHQTYIGRLCSRCGVLVPVGGAQ